MILYQLGDKSLRHPLNTVNTTPLHFHPPKMSEPHRVQLSGNAPVHKALIGKQWFQENNNPPME